MKKEKTKKPPYKYIGKETLSEIIAKTFPRQLIPTKRMGAIFGSIFILVLILAVLSFPLDSLISGGTNISISVGYPYPFLDFALTGADRSPLVPKGFAIDLFLYLIIAYIIDILITFILRNPLVRSKNEDKKYPTVFKNRKKETIPGKKMTKKVTQKQQLKTTTQSQPDSPPHPPQQP